MGCLDVFEDLEIGDFPAHQLKLSCGWEGVVPSYGCIQIPYGEQGSYQEFPNHMTEGP